MNYPNHQSILHRPKDLKSIAKKVLVELKLHSIKTIAVCGVSGTVLGGAVSALSSRIKLVIVRKEGEKNHYGRAAQGPWEIEEYNFPDYAFVDDLIATGNTLQRVIDSLGKKPSLIILYVDRGTRVMIDEIKVKRIGIE